MMDSETRISVTGPQDGPEAGGQSPGSEVERLRVRVRTLERRVEDMEAERSRLFAESQRHRAVVIPASDPAFQREIMATVNGAMRAGHRLVGRA